MRILGAFIIMAFSAFLVCGAFAAENMTYEDMVKELKALKDKVSDLEKKVAAREKKDISLENVREEVKKSLISYEPGEGLKVPPAGLRIGASGTIVAQGTPNANNAGDGEDSVFDASYKANIEIEKEFSDWGLAFLELEAGEHDSIESKLRVFSNVDRAASDTSAHIDVNKLWYEHYFFNRTFVLAGGKMEAADYMDQNAFAYDETTQFLARMFRNSPVIEFPSGNGPGLHALLCLDKYKCTELSFGIFEADADWDDIFSHMFYVGQVNIKPALFLNMDEEQWGGNYRFYYWANNRQHEKISDASGPAAEDTKETAYGFGISCDQNITDVFGLFARFGWQRADILPAGAAAADITTNPALEWLWATGAQMAGKYWRRPEDVLGFAVGQVIPGEKWHEGDPSNSDGGEGHIEVYYKCQLNQCLAITPDFQVIWNPYGVTKSSEGDNDAIFVYGMRAQIDF